MNGEAAQNGLMAAGYALLFFSILGHPARSKLRILLLASAFCVAYNLWYTWAIQWRVLTSIALLVRLLPPLEACWHLMDKSVTSRAALCSLGSVVAISALRPEAMAWNYMTLRNLATLSVTCICWIVPLSTWHDSEDRLFSVHGVLQAVWMSLHSLVSLTYGLYSSRPAWVRVRWAYVLASMLVVLLYKQVFRPAARYPEAQEASVEAEDQSNTQAP